MSSAAQKSNSVFRSVTLFGTAQVIALAFGLLLQAMLARTLTMGDYGRFAVTHTISLAMLMLLMSAVPNALRRLVSVHPASLAIAWRSTLRVQFPVAVTVAVMLAAVAPLVAGTFRDPFIVIALQLVAFEVAMRAGLVEPLWYLLNGIGRHSLQAVLMTGHSVLRFVCVGCLICLKPGLLEAVFGLLLSATISMCIAVVIVRRVATSTSNATGGDGLGKELVRWITLAPAVDVLNYFLVVGNLWIIKATCQEDAMIGTYAACFTIAHAIVPLGLVLSRSCFAPFARKVAQQQFGEAAAVLSQVVRAGAVVAGLVVVTTFPCGDAIVRLLYGKRFGGTEELLGILCLGMTGASMCWLLFEQLSAASRLKTRLSALAVVATVSVPATLYLTQAFGINGAAWALVVTGCVGMLAAGIPLRLLVGPFVPWSTLCRVAVAASGIAAFFYFAEYIINEHFLLLNVAVIVFGYCAILALLREWRLTDCWLAMRSFRAGNLPTGDPCTRGERL